MLLGLLDNNGSLIVLISYSLVNLSHAAIEKNSTVAVKMRAMLT